MIFVFTRGENTGKRRQTWEKQKSKVPDRADSHGPTKGKNQTLVGAIPFCGEYPGPRFEDKFRSANQIDGISKADGGKMADS